MLKLADFGESRLWTDTPSHGTAARAGGATATQHGSGHQSQTAARERNGAGIAAGPAIRSASTADDDRGNRRQALVRLAELPALNPAFRVIEERHSGRAALPAAAESRGYEAPEAAVPPPSGLPPRPRKPRSTGRRSYASAAQVAPSTRGTAALTRRRAAASSASLVVSKAASAVKPDAALVRASRCGCAGYRGVTWCGVLVAQYKATPQWSAPETFVGDHTYSAAADVFSMGLVMWEMWALNTPYHQVLSACVRSVFCAPDPIVLPLAFRSHHMKYPVSLSLVAGQPYLPRCPGLLLHWYSSAGGTHGSLVCFQSTTYWCLRGQPPSPGTPNRSVCGGSFRGACCGPFGVVGSLSESVAKGACA